MVWRLGLPRPPEGPDAIGAELTPRSSRSSGQPLQARPTERGGDRANTVGAPCEVDAEPPAEDSAILSALMMAGHQDRLEFLG
jgi:hypothetical protein